MDPLIRKFPSDAFYKGKLIDGDSISTRPFPSYLMRFKHDNVMFIDLKYT